MPRARVRCGPTRRHVGADDVDAVLVQQGGEKAGAAAGVEDPLAGIERVQHELEPRVVDVAFRDVAPVVVVVVPKVQRGSPPFRFMLVQRLVSYLMIYVDPPERALVLCVDEKAQIQALDRTQPTLPMNPGKAARMTHDDKCEGTTSLYAALEIAGGEISGASCPRHRHQEFVALLNRLVRAYPRRPLHVVLDNSSTHSTPEVERWLQRHKHVHFHLTPTSASWMNMVEIWFSILTSQQVRRGVYHDVPELIAAIEFYIEGYNERAQPFIWTKTADQILAKTTKHQPTSETLH